MKIQKILTLQLLILNMTIQPYTSTEELYIYEKFAPAGITITAAAITTYIWATSGDTVAQRIEDAQKDLAAIPEYNQEFDTNMIFGEKETQIKANLKQLSIDINNLPKKYNQKLSDDLIAIQKTYNNLWFKSFYGGKEIAELTAHVYKIKTQIKTLLDYLEKHQKFIRGHQIIQESEKLLRSNPFVNTDEIIKTATLDNIESNFPLYDYVKKIQQDIACIELLATEKNQDYPELSAMIKEYKSFLVETKIVITGMESYKEQALNKLEYDIAQLTEQCKRLELKIQKLEIDVAIAKMQR